MNFQAQLYTFFRLYPSLKKHKDPPTSFFPEIRSNTLPTFLFMSLATVTVRNSTFTNVFLTFQAISPRNRMLTWLAWFPSPSPCRYIAVFLTRCFWTVCCQLMLVLFEPLSSTYKSSLFLLSFTAVHNCTLSSLSDSHISCNLQSCLPQPFPYIQLLAKYCSDTVGVLVCCVLGLLTLQKHDSSLKS